MLITGKGFVEPSSLSSESGNRPVISYFLKCFLMNLPLWIILIKLNIYLYVSATDLINLCYIDKNIQLMSVWNSTAHQRWKPCVQKDIPGAGLRFLLP